MDLVIYTDGASRNNPGNAAIGYLITNGKKELERGGEYLGVATNNQAEYRALIKALKEARKYNPNKITCYSDSNLMVNQLKGDWKVKEPQLKDLHSNIKELEKKFEKVHYKHVKRDNPGIQKCDKQANEVLDLHTKSI
ncbi:reverse transcriptase-like protein [archaeon]|nr:reverse transcriptase-like protein [archaeon]